MLKLEQRIELNLCLFIFLKYSVEKEKQTYIVYIWTDKNKKFAICIFITLAQSNENTLKPHCL